MLPRAAGDAPTGARHCSHEQPVMLPRRPAMLPTAAGDAPTGGRRCSHGQPVLLSWAAADAPIVRQWCSRGRPKMLPLSVGGAAAGMLQTGSGAATESVHWCYIRLPALLQGWVTELRGSRQRSGKSGRDAASGGGDATGSVWWCLRGQRRYCNGGRRCCSTGDVALAFYDDRAATPAWNGGDARCGERMLHQQHPRRGSLANPRRCSPAKPSTLFSGDGLNLVRRRRACVTGVATLPENDVGKEWLCARMSFSLPFWVYFWRGK
jgi:hypothetical protein